MVQTPDLQVKDVLQIIVAGFRGGRQSHNVKLDGDKDGDAG